LRDTEDVWCPAVVKAVRMINQTEFLNVHYIGWSEIYDELVESNSQRIAPHGFYTSREDVPTYQINRPLQNPEIEQLEEDISLGDYEEIEAVEEESDSGEEEHYRLH
jgi:hypothetical protein